MSFDERLQIDLIVVNNLVSCRHSDYTVCQSVGMCLAIEFSTYTIESSVEVIITNLTCVRCRVDEGVLIKHFVRIVISKSTKFDLRRSQHAIVRSNGVCV